ncbi:hypothetical protein BKN38_09365 [Helicobacter sp. CLO-3]|uniref:hypothetical protein n=1 Tax=unclassified Helicobacter TaxID=2593540 RepID=UPI000805BE86|nr:MULTISPECIES: hypothetical protein [unclassified Helicobacter]OBV28629.1 hypothetical protein BA723_01815 [Helicobacter sp. CLO-3]OHU81296.1 hypothetical protein BKN38_09365 [Helicobacter sp. CLO-3]
MLYASSYLHAPNPKRMLFASGGNGGAEGAESAYVDRHLAPMKPRASHICISCVGYDALCLASVPSSAVQEVSPSDLSALAAYQDSPQDDALLQYNMTLESLCEYGVKNGILVAYKIYTATFIPYITQLPGAMNGDKNAPKASLKTYRLFALDVSNVDSGANKRAGASHNAHNLSIAHSSNNPNSAHNSNNAGNLNNAHSANNARQQTHSAKPYENLSAQILVPLVFLPLALDECPSGIYALDDWICVYQEGRLVYDCLCKDFGALGDCLAFVESFCGVKCESVAYIGGFLAAHFGAQNAKSSDAKSAPKLSVLDSDALESTKSVLDSAPKSAPDSTSATIPQSLARIRFSPPANRQRARHHPHAKHHPRALLAPPKAYRAHLTNRQQKHRVDH